MADIHTNVAPPGPESPLSPISSNQKPVGATVPPYASLTQPDHYYSEAGIPVFCPSESEFADFSRYVESLEPFAVRAGLCKVIPPYSWRERLEDDIAQRGWSHVEQTLGQLPLDTIRVDIHDDPVTLSAEQMRKRFMVIPDAMLPEMRPIVQHFNGKKGIYKQWNVEDRKRHTASGFLVQSRDANHAPPKDSVPRCEINEMQASTSPKTKPSESLQPNSETVGSSKGATDGIIVDRENDEVFPYTENPVTAIQAHMVDAASASADSSSRPAVSKADRAAMLDRQYWKNITFNPPEYGADVDGTLFPDLSVMPSWNPRDLGTLLTKIPHVPGVNRPYLYFGMWKATFSWHVEDLELYSINYLHFGEPKHWYCVAPTQHKRFERLAQNLFQEDYKQCSQFLRHKTFAISPFVLAHENIHVHRVVQYPGEFMLTFPFAYHSGFNAGFNCAESVNFALERWIPLGRKAKRCKCVKDSVTIDVNAFFPAPDVPTKAELGEYDDDDTPLVKRRKVNVSKEQASGSARGDGGQTHPAHVRELHKVDELTFDETMCAACRSLLIPTEDLTSCTLCHMRVHARCHGYITYTEVSKWKCMRCRSGERDVICRFCPYTNGPVKHMVEHDGHVPHRDYVHTVCALFIPELQFNDPRTKHYVVGMSLVPRARLSLRCVFCKLKEGACAQCSHGTCTTAFHATCALMNSCFLDWKAAKAYCLKHRPRDASPLPLPLPSSSDMAANQPSPPMAQQQPAAMQS